MAYQTRRDPLFDQNVQAAIEKRSRELIGIALLLVGMMAAAMMLSYTPHDPNWMASSRCTCAELDGAHRRVTGRTDVYDRGLG